MSCGGVERGFLTRRTQREEHGGRGESRTQKAKSRFLAALGMTTLALQAGSCEEESR
jgi:hypothetical protein